MLCPSLRSSLAGASALLLALACSATPQPPAPETPESDGPSMEAAVVTGSAGITLKTLTLGKYVVAENGGGGVVNANRDAASAWETFSLVDLSGGSLQDGDQIQLKASNGQFVCAEGGGGGLLNANRAAAADWETFIVHRLAGAGAISSGDQISLQTKTLGRYVCALNGGGSGLVADRTAASGWETFVIGQGGSTDPGTLNPGVAPGGNFDLSIWQLQEPVGSPGAPRTISSASLKGAAGYQDAYFYTDPADGSMTFWCPEAGVTTPNSNYARSELREMNANGSAANWNIAGTHTMSATLKVVKVPKNVCVGQIHIGSALQAGLPASTKPLLELYYRSNGDIVLGIENSPAGGQTAHPITNVPLNTKFSYTIRLTGSGVITLTINGASRTFTMPASFNGYGEYFKAGAYNQSSSTSTTLGALVKFYALKVTHQ